MRIEQNSYHKKFFRSFYANQNVNFIHSLLSTTTTDFLFLLFFLIFLPEFKYFQGFGQLNLGAVKEWAFIITGPIAELRGSAGKLLKEPFLGNRGSSFKPLCMFIYLREAVEGRLRMPS